MATPDNLAGMYTSQTDLMAVRAYIEESIKPELQVENVGRELCYKIFKFPGNARSYFWEEHDTVRATVIPELGAPPLVHPKTRGFHMDYYKIGIGTGITDEMMKFGDMNRMQMALDAARAALQLKQSRDIINCIIASVPFYYDGATDIYIRAMNADALEEQGGEWRTLTLTDDAANKCPKGHSHVVRGSGTDVDNPDAFGGPVNNNRPLDIDTILRARRLIAEHPQGKADTMLINPVQTEDLMRFGDFRDANGVFLSIPPDLGPAMTSGYLARWYGMDWIETEHVTPGTFIMLDRQKVCVLGEDGPVELRSGLRDEWHGWEGSKFQQWYVPAVTKAKYVVVGIEFTGDLKADGATTLDHSVKADVDASYTAKMEGT